MAASQQQALAAGSYGTVTLASGNGTTPTRLTLGGGLYQVKSLSLGNLSRIECAAPCELRTSGRVAVGDRSFIGPKAGVSGLGPGNVQLLVAGSNGSSGPSGTPPAIQVNNDGSLHAYTLAPNGTVRLGHRVDFRGKLVARDAVVGFDSNALGLQLPLITQHPQDLSVREDESAVFSVVVSNPTGVSYRWQRDGLDVQGPAGAGANYTIAHATMSSDGALFRVKVTNAAGTVVSQPGKLTVIPCLSSDATCDGFDDDCDGTNDEDFEPRCAVSGGAAVTCREGQEVTTACGNTNACDGVELCTDGECHPGTPPVLDDGNPCTADTCSPVGGIQHDPQPPGTACGDSNPCNGFDHCTESGECVYSFPVISNDPCLVSVCDSATGWGLEPAAAGTACDDGDHTKDPDVCDGEGNCVPDPTVVQRQSSRPGALRGGFGRPPEHRRTGSRAFRSVGFNDTAAGELADLVPATGNVLEVIEVPQPERTVRMHVTSYADHIEGCPLGSMEVHARTTILTGPEDVLIHGRECGLLGCEPSVPQRFVFGDYVFPSTVQAIAPQVQLLVNGSGCTWSNAILDVGFEVLDLRPPESGRTAERCVSGSMVDEFCWQAERLAGRAPPPNPRICFEWGTSFVDEGIGESEVGNPVFCTVGEQCGSGVCEVPPGAPHGPNPTCTMEQSYPARFAEVQLEVSGRSGTQTLGRHYDATGTPGAGTSVYLDQEGCLPEGSIDGRILNVISFASDSATSTPALRVRGRVRSSLRVLRSTGASTGYDVRYFASGSVEEPFEVVEFELFPQRFTPGWTLSDALPSAMTEAGTKLLLPPPVITLKSKTLVPGSNTSAALGVLLKNPEETFPPGVFEVRIGSDRRTCVDLPLICSTNADCPGRGQCSSGICQHCTVDSFFDPDTRALHIGPAVATPDAAACAQRTDCPETQNCLHANGATCGSSDNDGSVCLCSWPDQSSWKFMIGHEVGHQIQDHFVGDLDSTYDFSGDNDPAGIAAMCTCTHVTSATGEHCLQSAEQYTAALEEGFGHFIATRAFNDRENPSQAWFSYYKEVFRPELIPSIPAGYCDSRLGLCVDSPTPGARMALPPVPVNAVSAFKHRNSHCPSLPGGGLLDIRTMATEHDFLQFFTAVHMQGARISARDVSAILRSSCSSRDASCVLANDPSTCTRCAGGLCSDSACTDTNIPSSCGPCQDVSFPSTCGARRCDPGDVLRWSPLLSFERDGVDDPMDPNDDDVGFRVVSLVDGATRFLTQKYGADSDELELFIQRGTAHGVTPDLTP